MRSGLAQQLIIHAETDSPKMFRKKIKKAATDNYYGYFLMGIYNKNLSAYDNADEFFDRARELIPSGKIIAYKNEVQKRIEAIKLNR